MKYVQTSQQNERSHLRNGVHNLDFEQLNVWWNIK